MDCSTQGTPAKRTVV